MIDIFDDLNKRGLLDSYSDKEKIRELLKTPQTIYCGFDPSNKSMQLGNFIMIHILSKLQKAGHRIIAVVGGATGMIETLRERNPREAFGTRTSKLQCSVLEKTAFKIFGLL